VTTLQASDALFLEQSSVSLVRNSPESQLRHSFSPIINLTNHPSHQPQSEDDDES